MCVLLMENTCVCLQRRHGRTEEKEMLSASSLHAYLTKNVLWEEDRRTEKEYVYICICDDHTVYLH